MIERLAWDSDFFGYEVGRLRVVTDASAFATLAHEARDYGLVYVLAESPIAGLDLFDIKVTLERRIDGNAHFAPRVSVDRFTGMASDDLYRLALESGIHSRFRVDPGFRNNEFERLYRRWLDNSIERADETVLVARDSVGLIGFVSLAHAKDVSTIGLIAVDARARGQGVGSALLEACFAETQRAGNGIIRVVTQEPNTAAMALYARCGFHVAERTCIHHFRPLQDATSPKAGNAH